MFCSLLSKSQVVLHSRTIETVTNEYLKTHKIQIASLISKTDTVKTIKCNHIYVAIEDSVIYDTSGHGSDTMFRIERECGSIICLFCHNIIKQKIIYVKPSY